MLPGLGVYDPMIGSLCSEIENDNHLSLDEARAWQYKYVKYKALEKLKFDISS